MSAAASFACCNGADWRWQVALNTEMRYRDIMLCETTSHELMLRVATEVRDNLMAQHCDLTDTCDLGTDMLADKLIEHGVHGHVIEGVYRTRWGRMGHRWVEVDGWIIDPTRGQFGGKKLIQLRDETKIYIARDVVRTF